MAAPVIRRSQLTGPSIVLVDTSVFLNVLDAPGRNQDRPAVKDELRRLIEERATLLLPFVAIVETGNHIARLSNGGNRRRFARRFANEVRTAIEGKAPWVPTPTPTLSDIGTCLDRFPEAAKQGVEFADLSIIQEWERQRARFPFRRNRIWSLDGALVAHDTGAA
jgi:predicted nucleic acid-binding protein